MTPGTGRGPIAVDDAERNARLETWFRAYSARVLAFLLHRTDSDTAHDVLQEVFVLAFRKADAIPDPPVGWLFGTARHVLANTARGVRRRDRLALRVAEYTRGDEVVDDIAALYPDDGDLLDAVTESLHQLSAADQEVLTLSAWYELSAAEAAEALGCTRTAYGVRLHRARRRLADRLDAAGFTPDMRAEAGRE